MLEITLLILRISATMQAVQINPSIAVSGNTVYVAWSDNTSDYEIL